VEKQHLSAYPLIARSAYGFMVPVLGGLINYLLLAIYCHKYFQERVSINRVRELRINTIRTLGFEIFIPQSYRSRKITLMQKPNRTLLPLNLTLLQI
jgi:hypothetical protein